MENGTEFSVVSTKEHKRKFDDQPRTDETTSSEFQVVARVSDDIRKSFKMNKDKIFIDFTAHYVTDRLYVKSCSNFHIYGHYHAECTSKPSCGYCWAEGHTSAQCPVHEAFKNLHIEHQHQHQRIPIRTGTLCNQRNTGFNHRPFPFHYRNTISKYSRYYSNDILSQN